MQGSGANLELTLVLQQEDHIANNLQELYKYIRQVILQTYEEGAMTL